MTKNIKKEHMSKLFIVPEGVGLSRQVILNKDGEGKIPVEMFLSALEAEGLKDFAPKRPSRRGAMTAAVAAERNKHTLVDRLKAKGIVGYQITSTNSDGDTANTYDPQFSVYIDPQTLQFTHTLPWDATPEMEAMCERIRARYTDLFGWFTNDAIKVWLKEQVYRLGGVKMVDNGHVYFLPACSVEEFHTIKEIVEDISTHEITTLPMGQDVDLLRNITNSLEKEIVTAVRTAESTLITKEGAKAPGQNKLNTQVDVLDALHTKVELYEKMFNASLGFISDHMEDVRANLVLATLQANADDENTMGDTNAYDAALSFVPTSAPTVEEKKEPESDFELLSSEIFEF